MERFGVAIVVILLGLFITTAECLECYHCVHAQVLSKTNGVLPVGKACERGRGMPEEWIKKCPPARVGATPVCATLKGMQHIDDEVPVPFTVKGCFLEEKLRDRTGEEGLTCSIDNEAALRLVKHLNLPVVWQGQRGHQQICSCKDKDNCNTVNPKALQCYSCIYMKGKLPSELEWMNFGESCKTGIGLPEEWTTECRMGVEGVITPVCATSFTRIGNIASAWMRDCDEKEEMARHFTVEDKTNCIRGLRPAAHPLLAMLDEIEGCTCDRNNCNTGDATYGPTSYGGTILGPSVDEGMTHGPSVEKGMTHGPSVEKGMTHGPSVEKGMTHGPSVEKGATHGPIVDKVMMTSGPNATSGGALGSRALPILPIILFSFQQTFKV